MLNTSQLPKIQSSPELINIATRKPTGKFNEKSDFFKGYMAHFLCAVLMAVAAWAAWWLGLSTEQRSLEDIAPPLASAAQAE